MTSAHGTGQEMPQETSPGTPREPGQGAPEGFLRVEGQTKFLETFLPVRNEVIHGFYRTSRSSRTSRTSRAPRTGKRKDLRAAVRLLGGGAKDTVPDLYRLYYNRLFSMIWLALDWGPYTAEIRQVADPQRRIHLSQVNSVDRCWQPAVESAPKDGRLIEVGTGLSDGWARIAHLLPQVEIVSLTIERDQAEIGRRIAERLGLSDRVTFRVGDLFDPATTRDLAGSADAVTAMGVVPHFPPPRKAEGMRAMAAMLKPGAPLQIFDAYRVRPFSRFMDRALISSLCWYPTRDELRDALEGAGLSLTRFDAYDAESCLPFADDTRGNDQLRREFGPVVARVFPRIVSRFMKGLLAPQDSVYLSAVRR
ncbi:hypothetical protein C9F11_00910 [Streptomyces sp. YIM 121038]|uniref:class I SAM-dependent methyltransferase n=1 Tax=Streptomyces sp. YIM 121038 TaxID=2136401 RepID=UPI001164F625|nr:class I SAM-dependent methyltransferase [Streptomyces sp. YIM 121038]QCX73885.1 hypothetical protein C9F11_00910 [Streptomyces sp. YIM 121038]